VTDEQLMRLDAIADRLGALYQSVGAKLPDDTGLLDEIVAITEAIESVSNRKMRLYE